MEFVGDASLEPIKKLSTFDDIGQRLFNKNGYPAVKPPGRLNIVGRFPEDQQSPIEHFHTNDKKLIAATTRHADDNPSKGPTNG